MQFNSPKDLNRTVEIPGRDRTYIFKRGQLKSLTAKLSEAYSESMGDMGAMNALLDDFVSFMKIEDPLLERNLRSYTTDIVDRVYASDPLIASVPTQSALLGAYRLRHRALMREWQAEGVQETNQ